MDSIFGCFFGGRGITNEAQLEMWHFEMIYVRNLCGKYFPFCVREVSKHGHGANF
jgi:hypothetical protein